MSSYACGGVCAFIWIDLPVDRHLVVDGNWFTVRVTLRTRLWVIKRLNVYPHTKLDELLAIHLCE